MKRITGNERPHEFVLCTFGTVWHPKSVNKCLFKMCEILYMCVIIKYSPGTIIISNQIIINDNIQLIYNFP